MKQLLTLCLSLISIINLKAQEDIPTQNSIFNHIALSVKDVDASVAFYKSILNLNEITNRTKMDGIRWMSLGEDKELHLISTIEGDIKQNKAVHFAIASYNFEHFISILETKHILYSSWAGEQNKITIRADGVKQVYIQDPDDYWIEINSANKTQEFLIDKVKEIITNKTKAFTLAHITKDIPFLNSCFAKDATIFPPNSLPVSGMEAISKINTDWVNYGIKTFTETSLKIYGSENYIIDEGSYYLVYGPENTIDKGNYINIWKLEENEWKLYSNIWNSSLPNTTSNN